MRKVWMLLLFPAQREGGRKGHEFGTPGQEDAVPLTGVEGDYVAPAARDDYFQNEPNLVAAFDFEYATCLQELYLLSELSSACRFT